MNVAPRRASPAATDSSRTATRAATAALALFLGACAPLRLGPGGTPAAGRTFPDFTADPDSRPTISSGRAGWPIMPADPNAYVDDEGLHLFFSTFFCHRGQDLAYSWDPANPTACGIMNPVTAIAYAFSRDLGVTWEFRQTPLLAPSASGLDAGRIETASVFRRGDTLYLAYSADGEHDGRRFRSRYQIGLARLGLGRQSVREALMDESRHFERRAAPLLPFDLRPGRFDNNVQEPSVVIGPAGIVLYYVGLGFRLPDQPAGAPGQGIVSIGLGRAVLDEDLNVVSRSASAVLLGVNSTEVRYFDGAWHVFATTLSSEPAPHLGEAISYATSEDGVRWTAPRVILSAGSVAGFNDRGLTSPTAAALPGRVVLFYSTFGTAPGECLLVGPGGRFGLPLPAESKCLFVTVGRAVAARPGTGPSNNEAHR